MFLKLGLFTLAAASLAAAAPTPTINVDSNGLEIRAPAQFVHPGVMHNTAQLDHMKNQVAAGAQPWTDAYNAMIAHPFLSPTRTATPVATVMCGPTSNPDVGCHAEREDALAAYGNALAWYISGNAAFANKAISIMNAWAKVLKAHTLDNALLQTGWAGTSFARAAEIIRHTGANWAASDLTAFQNLLRNVYLPTVINGSDRNGNWDLVMLETAIGISVFLDDGASYDKAMNRFKGRVPAYIYLKSDGSSPKAAPGSPQDGNHAALISFWYDQQAWQQDNQDGQAQETCRDFTHTGYGLASIGHVLETSRIQGSDLYGTDLGTRLRFALGFHSQLTTGSWIRPSWLCPSKASGTLLDRPLEDITEVGFNALSTRLGNAMAQTEILTNQRRPAKTNNLFVGWETLTNAGAP